MARALPVVRLLAVMVAKSAVVALVDWTKLPALSMDNLVSRVAELPLPLVLNSSLPPRVEPVGVPSTVATTAAAVKRAVLVTKPENSRLPSASSAASTSVGATDDGLLPLDLARVIVAPPSVPLVLAWCTNAESASMVLWMARPAAGFCASAFPLLVARLMRVSVCVL